MNTLLIIFALTLMLAGAAGTVFPALPGLPLLYGGIWLLAYTQDYQIIGSGTLLFLLLPVIFGMAMDFIAGLMGAKYTGASQTALWGAFVGGIAGMFFGLPGLLIGPVAGAMLGEAFARSDLIKAGKVGIGTFIGFIIGVAAKVGAALVMLFTALWQYLAHWLF